MKIYTKTGDKGQTQIYSDKLIRMEKSADVLECYGTLDELNAHVGLLLHYLHTPEPLQLLTEIQHNLFQIGFAISATTKIEQSDLKNVEQAIDEMQKSLPPQTSFILPGGGQAGAQAHICRTVARRAERRLVALLSRYPVPDLCVGYLNRLSDYFFVLARFSNFQEGLSETKI